MNGAIFRIGVCGWVSWLMLSGFSLNPGLVPVDEIVPGGPPRDGIPALTDPAMESGKAANRWLMGNDRVLGLVINGQARAYPVRILNWHEIVKNSGKPVISGRCRKSPPEGGPEDFHREPVEIP